jgi:proteasome accessory factor B
MERTLSRAERLRARELLLYNARMGLTVSEIAANLDVHRSTVYRDVDSLSKTGVPIWEEDGRFGLNRERYLTTVRLDLHQALALYLAARLLSAHSDKHNPHAVSAMEKLASAMPPSVGEHIAQTARVADRRRRFPAYLETLEALTRAWADRRQVWLRYENPRTGEVTERVFDPYFIEPSPYGFACYAIGHDHRRGAIRQFMVERIGAIRLLETTYEVRGDFDPYAYLANAWGVMGGAEVQTVKLRFSKDVTYRIRESDWPGVTGVTDEPAGGCVMTLRVSHTLEMVPWIRGWGPDCEVIEPEALRRQIAEDMRAAAEVYRKGDGRG